TNGRKPFATIENPKKIAGTTRIVFSGEVAANHVAPICRPRWSNNPIKAGGFTSCLVAGTELGGLALGSPAFLEASIAPDGLALRSSRRPQLSRFGPRGERAVNRKASVGHHRPQFPCCSLAQEGRVICYQPPARK